MTFLRDFIIVTAFMKGRIYRVIRVVNYGDNKWTIN